MATKGCAVTMMLIWLLKSVVFGTLRYTEMSCSDLVPRSVQGYRDFDSSNFYGYAENEEGNAEGPEINEFPQFKKRSVGHYAQTAPFKITVNQERYRRNSDLQVMIEGGEFDGMMLQSRVVSGGELTKGSLGLIGQFRFLPYMFDYIPCFGLPFATVADKGRPIRLSNASFIWTAPDSEAGDIQFLGSVLKGNLFWIIVSKVLEFNPFPISTYSCGSSLACFRICKFGAYPCMAKEALFMFAYNVDLRDKREITFTMGGHLDNDRQYIAVAFGEDFSNLVQADVMLCYLERGRAKLEHLLIESLHVPPYQHNEVVELEDFDIDGNMLWCKFRRSIISSSINPTANLYHFYFWGKVDHTYNRFILPPRHHIYNSAFRRNFTTPFNEILSGCNVAKGTHLPILMATFSATFHIVVFSLWRTSSLT